MAAAISAKGENAILIAWLERPQTEATSWGGDRA
jgi:hypothetical protein